MKQVLFLAAAILIFASCNVNYQKSPSGLLYKIFPGKEKGPLLKPGQFAKLDIIYSVHLAGSNKDSILNATAGKIPAYSPVDTSARSRYTPTEILNKCRVGDSIECLINVDTLKNRGEIPEYTKAFARGGVIHCNGRILQVFDNQKDVMEDYQNAVKKLTADETKDLQAYVDKKGVKTQSTKSGVLVHVENVGDTANMADSGKQASIYYKGSLETTGTVFETNMDTLKVLDTSKRKKPIDVILGMHRVIPGWEEGLQLFGKGGKGTLYIPAMLAYGGQGRPPVIPQYSNLIFDIEVVDVKIAPPQPMRNPMGHLTPQQMQQMQQMMQKAQHPKDSTGKKK